MHPHPAGMPPYGQMPMPSLHRRHEVSYPPMPPTMRPQQPYPGYYHHPHMPGSIPSGPPQYPTHWYPYQHVHHPPPHPQQHAVPPRSFPYHQHQMQQVHYHGGVMAPPPVPHHPQHSAYPVPSTNHQSPASSSQSPFPSQSHAPSSIPTQSPSSPPPSRAPSAARVQPETPPSTSSVVSQTASEISTSSYFRPFFPPLPWSSVGDQPFPRKVRQHRRRIMRSQLGTPPVNFPLDENSAESVVPSNNTTLEGQAEQLEQQQNTTDALPPTEASKSLRSPSEPIETPTSQTSQDLSDSKSTDPTSVSTAETPQTAMPQSPLTPQPRKNRSTVPMAPIIPAVPVLPPSPKSHRHTQQASSGDAHAVPPIQQQNADNSAPDSSPDTPAEPPQITLPPAPPKSWADLVRSKSPPKAATSTTRSSQAVNGFTPNKSETLSEALNAIDLKGTTSVEILSFLKPRGLVNTGNMCYMNSVLQILIFTIPFNEFLKRVGQKSSHSFKSDTPLIDAMILFMREFPAIDSADSYERLRLRLKPEELELYGDPFAPEYVYQAIRELPRFRDMRRGHQQDAQEFLGFLLEELHEECARAIRGGNTNDSESTISTEVSSSIPENDGGWMEVGQKQKPAITRSSGLIATESPVTKIFGGKLRSEWKVPGNKNSVTLEPYQSLQLDIGSPQVNTIVDALKGLTRPESMQGDFNSSRGTRVTATKQVFIETLPPVLILHLKRFQYDGATRRTEKIWKKIGYPLELELPKEVFPTSVRNKLPMRGGLPSYQLTGVIYHHGRNAGGGHYTVDVRRQDGQEWIRLDDTVIRRVRSEEVIAGGSSNGPQGPTSTSDRTKQQSSGHSRNASNPQSSQQQQHHNNVFEGIKDEEEDDSAHEDEQAWSQVNGHARNKPSTSGAANEAEAAPDGPSTPSTPRERPTTDGKENKVAYLLFYRRENF